MYDNWPSFDELLDIARKSPEQLEVIREQEVDNLIQNAPKEMRRRLKGIQFQVNCQRQLHKTSMGACVAISNMMHESLGKLNRVLNSYVEDSADSAEQHQRSNVVSFPGSSSSFSSSLSSESFRK